MRVVAGTEVYTLQGTVVGAVERVIIDPRSYTLTHLVIRKGGLFAEDRVLPVECVATLSGDRIVLDVTEFDLEALPCFDPTHFRPLDAGILGMRGSDEAPPFARPYFWFPPVMAGAPDPGAPRPMLASSLAASPGEWQAAPADAPHIAPGTPVYSAEGRHIGTVERIYGALNGEHTSHIQVIMRGATGQRALVLVEWIEGLFEGKLYLAVDETFLRTVQSYQADTSA